jgi:hypothetical protein
VMIGTDARTCAGLACCVRNHLLFAFALAIPVGMACHDENDDSSPDQVAEACEVIDDCYDGIDHADLHGEVVCLDRVEGGHCTHLCESDADCCAVEGECETDLAQVCAPFESSGMMMCFLSCEDDVIEGEEETFCQDHAHPDFACRSSGGGSANRKVCVP